MMLIGGVCDASGSIKKLQKFIGKWVIPDDVFLLEHP